MEANMKWLSLFTAAALLVCARALAQQDPGALIIAGGGFAGPWDTEIELANTHPGAIEGTIGIVGLPLGAPCPPACTETGFLLPPNGTLRLSASTFLGEFYEGPQMIRVTTSTEAPLPVVHARIVNRDRPSQAADLPVLRESTVEALDTTTLVFPGVSRLPGVYTNLILETDAPDLNEATEVLIEAYDGEGRRLGSGPFLVAGQQTSRATTLVDVLSQLGVVSLEGGQLRVTHSVAGRTLWGVRTIVSRIGALGAPCPPACIEGLSVAAGANP
jgi:hypothetical protein